MAGKALEELWVDSGYRGENALFLRARKAGLDVSRKDVKNFLREQSAAILTKSQGGPKVWAKLPVPNERWGEVQSDLVFMKPVCGYKYLMTAIDVFSRRLWVRALKNKRGETIMDAWDDIQRSSGLKTPPKVFLSDMGTEFSQLGYYLQDQGSKVLLAVSKSGKESKDHNETAFVERVHRTLKESLGRAKIAKPGTSWLDNLPQAVTAYNNSPHAGLEQLTPNEMWKIAEVKPDSVDIRDLKAEKKKAEASAKFMMGDRVRVRLKGGRSGEQRWSKRTYEIVGIMEREPVTYQLEGRDGSWYERDLQFALDQDLKDPGLSESKPESKPESAPVVSKKNERQQEVSKKYTVEKILEPGVTSSGAAAYLIKWEGYPEPTLETRFSLMRHVPEMVKDYDRKHDVVWKKRKGKSSWTTR